MSARSKEKSPGATRDEKPEPCLLERQAIDAATARNALRPRRVKLDTKLTGSKLVVDTPHSDRSGWSQTLSDAFASSERDFATFNLGMIMEVADPSGQKSLRWNAATALIGGIGPKDELEAAVATQMAAVHALTLDCLSRAASADVMDKRDAFISQATKLGRTFTAQFEALHKSRNGGRQQVEVRHVHIDARGGQNIIGSRLGGGGTGDERNQSHATDPAIAGLEFAPGVAVWSEDASGAAMPEPSGTRQGEVQDARSPLRRPDRKGQRRLPDGDAHARDASGPADHQRARQARKGDAQ